MLALAFLFVFLFLAAQYESWLIPVAVILSLPIAGIGAYLGNWACGLENNIYFQIGLVMLVGLVAKNAILIVEFAKDEVEKGRDILTAVILAARLRFRPIVMTSLAFILGMLPLVFASGPGSASRQGIGTGVFFGMLVAITVGIVFVPLFFVGLQTERKMDNTMKRSATYLLGVLLLLAAGSCSVQKKCKAPQLDMPAEIVAGQSDTLTLSDRKWWEVYTDTTLCRLIGRTLDRNRNMLSAEARIRQLEELYRVSKAARLPSLGGLAAADYETNDYYGEAHKGDAEFDVKATLSWEADLWGNLRWAKRKGAAEYLASVEAARAMQMTLVAEVATAYFELVALDHELGVVRRTVETREESVRQAKLRFEGGLTSETAYQQAKVELASASALIPDLELRIAQKENQISVLAGDYPSRVARSKMDMNVRMPDSLPVGLPSTLLQRRPDVRQAEQNLKAAMASAGMAYADRFPRLTISLTGGLENDALKGLINSPFSYAAGNLTAPLFAFGSKRAKYRAALAAYDQARLAYEQKVLEVFREVNDAVTAYRNMRRTAELKFNLKEAARQYVVLAKLQYINGVIRYIDVLDAQRKFFDAQVEESKAVRNEHLALVGLYKALGGGWQPSDAGKKG